MPRDTLYLACYDITDDPERERVAGVLQAFGFRVQRSVFECRLTRSAKERLLVELEKIKLKTGFLILYKLGPEAGRRHVGSPPEGLFADERFSLVI